MDVDLESRECFGVVEVNPEKQGLKHGLWSLRVQHQFQVVEVNPEKQGLKHNRCIGHAGFFSKL